jgi:hydroxypyruvate isomerase
MALRCTKVNCLAGLASPRVAPEIVRPTLLEKLRFGAGQLKQARIELLAEPINVFDIRASI